MKLNNRQQIALTKVINYLYTEEEKHFEESNRPIDHIFKEVTVLNQALKNKSVISY
tara:strand:- start:128 stop:295 length:168 start_codon:yes stop_codon:yes gene_type:complete